jgi:hypothetical protein
MSNLGLTKLGFLVVPQLLTRHNALMTTYLIVAKWGPMTLSEEMDITSDFNTETESEYCRNHIHTKWARIFGSDFITNADEITVKELSHS